MSNTRYEFSHSDMDDFKPKLLYITKAKYDVDWHSTPHVHPFMEIMFVTGGEGQILVGNHVCDIHYGDLAIFRPNFVHTEKSSAKKPLEYIILGIQNVAFDIMRSEVEDDAFSPVFPFSQHFDKTLNFINDILYEINNKKINYIMMAQGLTTTFLVYVMRHTNLAIDNDLSNSSLSKECAFVKQYIDTHFVENVTLDFLAEKCYISKFHLAHIFKKSLGVSPIQYLIERRLKEAKTLLETTTHAVTEISQYSGFPSHNHFADKFKKHTGMNPSQYRKLYAKSTPAKISPPK